MDEYQSFETDQDKTELMIFAPKHRVKDISDVSINFGGSVIYDAPFVKKFGCLL